MRDRKMVWQESKGVALVILLFLRQLRAAPWLLPGALTVRDDQELHRFELFFVVHDRRRIRLELTKGNRVILTIFVGRNTL